MVIIILLLVFVIYAVSIKLQKKNKGPLQLFKNGQLVAEVNYSRSILRTDFDECRINGKSFNRDEMETYVSDLDSLSMEENHRILSSIESVYDLYED